MSCVIAPPLPEVVEEIKNEIQRQMEGRCFEAANELRNAAMLVLRGQRGGRSYRVPGTKRYYHASAPGEPPAVRTGAFRASWQPRAHVMFGSYISRIETDLSVGGYTLGEILENGTPGGQMAPRPHHDKILEKAKGPIMKIYDAPYF